MIDRKLITLKTQRAATVNRIKKVILDERKIEEELDKEVEALIKKNISAVGKEAVDYNKMFSMIKSKLAKERGVVL